MLRTRTTMWLQTALVACSLVALSLAAAPAHAAPAHAKKAEKGKEPSKVPSKQPASPDPDAGGGGGADEVDLSLDPDKDLFVRNIVQSATKSVTTVQEAPTIINVITAEDIESYGYRDIMQVMMGLPSHLMTNSQNSTFPYWTVRGVSQAMLYMKDGLSLFDPVFNTVPSGHVIPLENIKRIEVMTNPGGVLWGANSFLGIANVITKDAEDVDGVEMALGFAGLPGAGFQGGPCRGSQAWYCSPGDSGVIRPYLMYGKTFFDGQLKVFAHLSTEFFRGPIYRTRSILLYSPPPRLNSPTQFTADESNSVMPMSLFGQFDGKVSWVKPGSSRKLVLGWQWQFLGLNEGHARPMNFLLTVSNWDNTRGNQLRAGYTNWRNQFVYLQYRDRFYKDRIGLNTRLFYSRFDRQFQVLVFPYQENVVEGVSFQHSTAADRVGWTFDLDFQLHRTVKLLAGGEMFYEWTKDSDAWFMDPMDQNGQLRMDRLSVICPFYDRNGDGLPIYDPNDPNRTNYVDGCRQPFIFDSDRMVFAGFLSASWRPIRRLTFDAGVRVQAAPIGNVGYDPVVLYSGAAVLRLFDQWYLKANYSTGFRAPIFINTSGNPAMVDYAGDPNIKSETSQAITTELYAKLLRNKGRVREWDVRLDYAYTELKDRIVILSGAYENAEGTSAIHSVEFLSKLYLKGGHAFSFAYTYYNSWGPNRINGGFFRSVPNHWFATAGVYNVVNTGRWRLDLNTSLRVTAAFEDPNRIPTDSGGSTVSGVGWDRIPSQAFWNFGARLRVKVANRPLELKANFYNLLNGGYYNIDPNFALAPRTEQLPVPLQRFHFFIQLKYRI